MEEDLKIYQGNAISDADMKWHALKDLFHAPFKIKKQDRLEGNWSYKFTTRNSNPS